MVPKEDWVSVAKKLAIDQTVFAPTIVASFFVGISLLEGKGLEEIKGMFQKEYLNAMKMNYVIWPAAQLSFVDPISRFI